MSKKAGLVVLVCGFCIQLAIAQTTGTISGVVQDGTGAVVPGASVTVRNVETGISRSLPTDAQGRYQARNLSVGQYEVEATVSGFQTGIRRGIVLTVGQEAVVNFSLQVGQVAERVEVTGEAPLVETTNSAITGLADENTIRNLPLNGRSYTDIVLLQAGTVLGRSDNGSQVGKGEALGGGAKISVSGARPGQNSYLLDGTDINDSRPAAPAGSSGLLLGVDSVREFRLLTNAYSAEYGRASGGVLTAVTKSGSNDFHGTLFEFLRNDKVDAASWEATARGTKVKPPFRRNQFGGTVGGPIIRNKTFFFGSFEALRDRLGESQLISVPTARAKQGFIPRFGIATNPEEQVTIHPLSQRFLAFYPTPNGADHGDGTGDYAFSSSQPTDQDNFSIRGDHSFSPNHSIFARHTFDDSSRTEPTTPLPNRQSYVSRNQYLTIQYDSILTPTTLNAARFGMNRSTGREVMNYIDSFDLTALSFTDRPFNLGGSLNVDGIQEIGTDRVPRGHRYRLFEGSDDVTLIRSSHTLKTGLLFKKIISFEETWNVAAGQMSFDGGIASSSPASTAFYDFLLGRPSQLGVMWPGAEENREWNMNFVGAYLQDDFKWKPNFTWNLGVRLEFMTSPNETEGKCSNITRVDQVLPFKVGETTNPNGLPGAPLGTVGCPFFKTFKNNWAPRIGFAWDTRSNSKLVVRGGFGFFYEQPFPGYWKAAGRCCPPFSIEAEIDAPPFAKLQTFRNTSNPPEEPVDVRSWDYTGTAYAMQYNLNIQSEIRRGTGITLGYSGSQGRKLAITRQINILPREIRDGQVFTTQFPTSFTAEQLRPFLINPFATSILLGGTQGSSNYNAFLATVDQRFSGGLRAGLAYTYSKTMSHNDTVYGADFGGGDGTTGTLDGYDIGRDWAAATYSLRHVLNANYSYDLPFQGQGVVGKVIDGWQVSGIASLTSGVPFSATSAFRSDHQRSSVRLGQGRPSLIGSTNNPIEGATAGCTVGTGSSARTIAAGRALGTPDLYFDPCAFALPARGFFGNLGRNTLTGPGYVRLDFSLIKNTFITEGTNLQFRAEFFNIANHPNFSKPAVSTFDSSGRLVTTGTNPAGRINTTIPTSRQIQFALKLVF